VFEFARGIQRIGVDDNQASPHRTKQRDRILQDVGHHKGNSITLPEALVLQPGSKIPALFIELCVCDYGLEITESWPLFIELAAPLKNFKNRSILVQINCRGHPFGVIGQPGLVHIAPQF